MKKLLALVLALVMTLGLATVGANAAYKDADSINYKEAVDVMSAIGILGGDETGFRPADTLKRSEGAKIVAYLLLGNKAAEAIQATGAKYTDLPANHWAAGYMEYLSAVGVMGGIGDGKIDPDGQLTTTAFAKMLLTSLGYDAQIEGFGGTDWSINVQKVANQVGIFDGNRSASPNAAVTREEAALYAFNTIQSPLVEYANKGTVVSVGGATVTTSASNATYKTNTIAKSQTISDDVLNGGIVNSPYIVEFAEEYYPDLKLVGLGTGYNDFGQPIRKWTNANVEVGTYVLTEGLVNTYTKKVTAKDLYDLLGKERYDSLVANSTKIALWEDGILQQVIGKDYDDYTGIAVSALPGAAATVDPVYSRNDNYQISSTGNGSITEVYLNEDNDINVVTYHTYVFQAATNYSASTESLIVKPVGDTADYITLASLTLSAKDFPEIAEYEAEDYLLVNAYYSGNGRWTAGKVAKAELVTGTVEGFKAAGNVTLDGKTYEYSAKTNKTGGGDDVTGTTYSVGQKAVVVLDKYENIIAVDEAIVNENYVFIAKVGTDSTLNSNIVAEAYFTDGTSKQITIKKVFVDANHDGTIDTTAVTNTNLTTDLAGTGFGQDTSTKGVGAVSGATKPSLYAGWYTYSTDADGKYTLTAVIDKQIALVYGDGNNNTDVAVKNDAVQFLPTDKNGLANTEFTVSVGADVNGNTIRANDKTIMVVEQDGDIYTYTGVKNFPDIQMKAEVSGDNKGGMAAVFATYDDAKSNYAKYVFVTLTGYVSFYDGSSSQLLYVLSQEGTYTTANQKKYTKYNVLDENGTKIVVEASETVTDHFGANAAIANNDAATQVTGIYNAFYKTSKNSDGWYTKADKLADGNNAGNQNSGAYFDMHNLTNGAANSTNHITYSNGTLQLGTQFFTVNDDTVITLVTLKTATSALNKDKDASYEVTRVSASTLASLLDTYTGAIYNVQGKVDGTYGATAYNRVLKEAYVTVVKDGIAATSIYSAVSMAVNASVASCKVDGSDAPQNVLKGTTVPVLITPVAGSTITKVVASAGTLTGTYGDDGTFAGTLAVGSNAAITLTVTTKTSVALGYKANQSAIVTEAGGSAVTMTSGSALKEMSAVPSGEAITFTVEWADTVPDYAKVVAYANNNTNAEAGTMSGDVIAPFSTNGNKYTYSIEASETATKQNIVIGSKTVGLTIPTNYNVSWTGTSAANNKFVANSTGLDGDGSEVQVPVSAAMVVKYTPDAFATWTQTNAPTVTGFTAAADAVWSEDDAVAKKIGDLVITATGTLAALVSDEDALVTYDYKIAASGLANSTAGGSKIGTTPTKGKYTWSTAVGTGAVGVNGTTFLVKASTGTLTVTVKLEDLDGGATGTDTITATEDGFSATSVNFTIATSGQATVGDEKTITLSSFTKSLSSFALTSTAQGS